MKKKESKDCQERGRRFFFSALLVVGTVLLLSAFSHSGNRETTGHFGPGSGRFITHLDGKLSKVLDHLDATGSQREQAEAILADLEEYSDHFDAARKDLSSRLIEALAQKDIDVESFASIRIEMLELTDEASAKLFDALYDLSELLTPGQRAELLKLVREHS
jgi:Spy/CpxP family protein refolding chaperone